MSAALLLARPERGLSHGTATALHKLIPSMPPSIDVTTTHTRPRNQRDVVVVRVIDEQVDLPATIDRLERWFAGPGATRAGPAPAPARRGGTRRTR